MTRLSFFKSLAALAISGTVARQLGAEKPVVLDQPKFDPVAYKGEFRSRLIAQHRPASDRFGYTVIYKCSA